MIKITNSSGSIESREESLKVTRRDNKAKEGEESI